MSINSKDYSGLKPKKKVKKTLADNGTNRQKSKYRLPAELNNEARNCTLHVLECTRKSFCASCRYSLSTQLVCWMWGLLPKRQLPVAKFFKFLIRFEYVKQYVSIAAGERYMYIPLVSAVTLVRHSPLWSIYFACHFQCDYMLCWFLLLIQHETMYRWDSTVSCPSLNPLSTLPYHFISFLMAFVSKTIHLMHRIPSMQWFS